MLAILILSFTYINAMMNEPKTIPSHGEIKTINVDVFQDQDLTTALTSIYWGKLEPSEVANHTCYIYNRGNTPVTLTFVIDNWNPLEAEQFLDFSTDYSGVVIQPKTSLEISLSLTVNPLIEDIDSFSFDITIIGIEEVS